MRKFVVGAIVGLLLLGGFNVAFSQYREWIDNLIFRIADPVVRFENTLTFQNKSGTRIAALHKPTVPTVDYGLVTVGTDNAFFGKVNGTLPGGTTALAVTFATAFNVAPVCVGQYGNTTYPYYIRAVSTTTTIATITLGSIASGDSDGSFGFAPHDTFRVHCTGA